MLNPTLKCLTKGMKLDLPIGCVVVEDWEKPLRYDSIVWFSTGEESDTMWARYFEIESHLQAEETR